MHCTLPQVKVTAQFSILHAVQDLHHFQQMKRGQKGDLVYPDAIPCLFTLCDFEEVDHS